MLSRIERGESSPTAQLMNKVCGGLGITLSALFAEPAAPRTRSRGARRRPTWRDPATRYLRRERVAARHRLVDRDRRGGVSARRSVAFDNMRLPQRRAAGVGAGRHAGDGRRRRDLPARTGRLPERCISTSRWSSAIRPGGRFATPSSSIAVRNDERSRRRRSILPAPVTMAGRRSTTSTCPNGDAAASAISSTGRPPTTRCTRTSRATSRCFAWRRPAARPHLRGVHARDSRARPAPAGRGRRADRRDQAEAADSRHCEERQLVPRPERAEGMVAMTESHQYR